MLPQYDPINPTWRYDMTAKTYTKRDSATAVLKKAGIDRKDYDQYITKKDDVFVINVVDGAPVSKSAKAPKAARTGTVSAVARALILEGKDNKAVWGRIK